MKLLEILEKNIHDHRSSETFVQFTPKGFVCFW